LQEYFSLDTMPVMVPAKIRTVKQKNLADYPSVKNNKNIFLEI